MKTQVTRREFLYGTTLASAGLVIAVCLPAKANLRAQQAQASFQPNAWLQIDP